MGPPLSWVMISTLMKPMLSDTLTYRRLDSDPIMRLAHKAIEKGIIDEKLIRLLQT